MSAKVHLHLHVSDLVKSRDFYERFLGAGPVKVKSGYVKFLPEWAPVNLALSEGGHAVEGTVNHVGVQVETVSAVMDHLARAKAAGLPVREEMGVNCCHANQDKFWVQDPDGVEWEVYHLNYDLEDEVTPGTASATMGLRLAKGNACCSSDRDIKQVVKEKYGKAALKVSAGGGACCGSVSGREGDPITSNLYSATETGSLPSEATAASLGCGNPTALAELTAGETVLDLGSGGGIDVLLSARRVGPTGKAYGLDMTDEMLTLARENQRKAGVTNVEFLKGEIEAIPLPDESVDVITSNCVINLSADKDRVLAEAFRVLRPGGRVAVSDVVVRGEVPPVIRRSVELWIGCVAGALEEREYRDKLAKAGFEGVEVEPTRVYRVEDARELLAGSGIDADAIAPQVDGKFMSAFVRARKPRAR
ncbi:MAG TPA: ArsI/CadI family heavy metal resistance metalloenzyme [Tepidiformaceae bacterium]|nr:ArsI/CadI family heavy metal resistance metalloenzyme [Tepidiformaceae bacterium]